MKNTIAIVALVQNTSAIQLNQKFVSLAQSGGFDVGELGILGGNSGANPEMSELGGLIPSAPAAPMNNEMDELGLGPPQPSGSMKDMITGAPPPGFADYMRKKAEKAEKNKNNMMSQKMEKLKAMRAAQLAQREAAKEKAEADRAAAAAQAKHDAEIEAAKKAEEARLQKEKAEAEAAAKLAAEQDAAKKEALAKEHEATLEALKKAEEDKFQQEAKAQIAAQNTIAEKAKADQATKEHDLLEIKEVQAKDDHDQAEFIEKEAEKKKDLDLRKAKVADALGTWEQQQFTLSVEQDKANFQEEDRQRKALNAEFEKFSFTMEQDSKRADNKAKQEEIKKDREMQAALEARRKQNEDAIAATKAKEEKEEQALQDHNTILRKAIKEDLEEINQSSKQQDEIIKKNRAEQPNIAALQAQIDAKEAAEDAAAQKQKDDAKAAEDLKAVAAKKDQDAKLDEVNEQNKEDNKAIRKELDKNAKAKAATEKGEEPDEDPDQLAKELGGQGVGPMDGSDKKAADKATEAKKDAGEAIANSKEDGKIEKGEQGKPDKAGAEGDKAGADGAKAGAEGAKAGAGDTKKEGAESADTKKIDGEEDSKKAPAKSPFKKESQEEAVRQQIINDKPAGSPETPNRDIREALKTVAKITDNQNKEDADKAAKDLAAAPKAENEDGSIKLVPALAVDGTVNGSSKFHKSDAELWTENMPKHVQDYNGGLGATLYASTKFAKPWGADIE